MSPCQFCQCGIRSIKFFRKSLISLSASAIEERLVRLDEEIKDFKTELYRISWYMRGGVTINDLLDRYSFDDREVMSAIIKENIEVTKETRLPLL